MDTVKRFAKAVYRAAIKIPLTAGYPTRNGNPDETNGSLASVVTIVFVTAVTFAIIGIFGAKQSYEQLANKHILIMMVLLMLSALMSVVFISMLAYKNRESWYKPSELRRIAIYTNIKVAFLWLFGFACILHESLGACMDLNCWSSPESDDLSWNPIARTFSHFLQILSLCCQLSFITYFRYYKFEPSLCINYGILIILLANLSKWFDSLIKEINLNPYSERKNETLNIHCLLSSSIYNITEDLEPYVDPARVEFYLLSTGFIISMWPSIQEDEESEPKEMNPASVAGLSEPDDELALLMPGSSTSINYNTVQLRNDLSNTRIHPVSHFCSIVTGIVLNMSLIIGNIVFVYLTRTEKHESVGLREAWFTFTLVYKLCMMILIYMIYYHITWNDTPFQVKPKKLSSGQYLLIFSTSGTVALCTIGIIVGTEEVPEKGGYLFIFENCVDIMGTYLQTVLIIHAEKLVVRSGEGSSFALDRLCLLLSVSNLSLWLIDSFIDVQYIAKFRTHNEKIIDTGTLENIVNILSPILIFYRFHVSLDWYNLHRKFKQNS
ncbi:uncharacterized protein LOC133205611 [Saccostrea echinata]|uniref:uncharacterized protein LOC133205611 n=1 Tax=Saccostrea echinata TaxID=191078 RepID=UPI002A802558|nr:uncharacterized protein LOC133205611 [Saccostrea echinata]